MGFMLMCLLAGATAAATATEPAWNGTDVPLLIWRNWGRNQVCYPDTLVKPRTEDEMASALSYARSAGLRVKVVGAGHSFSPVALTDGLMVSLDRMDKVVSVDAKALRVSVQAGIRVHVLNDALAAKGLALENMGAIAQQSMAGATQTSTHGTGTVLGSMSTQIVGMRLMLANSTVLDLDQASPLLPAARVGLGVLGVVTQVTLRVVPLFRLERVTTIMPLPSLLDQLPTLLRRFPRLQYYWTPLTANTTGGVQMATLLTRAPTDKPISGCWPDTLHRMLAAREDPAVAALLAAGGNGAPCSPILRLPVAALTLPPPCSHLLLRGPLLPRADARDRRCGALHRDGDVRRPQRHRQRPRGLCLLPAPGRVRRRAPPCSDALGRPPPSPHPLDARLRRPKHDSEWALFTGVRYVAADDNWLSPMYQRNASVVSQIVFGTNSTGTDPSQFALFAKGLEGIAQRVQGRPHWGKMNWASPQYLRSAYPRFADFASLRAQLDPKGAYARARALSREGTRPRSFRSPFGGSLPSPTHLPPQDCFSTTTRSPCSSNRAHPGVFCAATTRSPRSGFGCCGEGSVARPLRPLCPGAHPRIPTTCRGGRARSWTRIPIPRADDVCLRHVPQPPTEPCRRSERPA